MTMSLLLWPVWKYSLIKQPLGWVTVEGWLIKLAYKQSQRNWNKAAGGLDLGWMLSTPSPGLPESSEYKSGYTITIECFLQQGNYLELRKKWNSTDVQRISPSPSLLVLTHIKAPPPQIRMPLVIQITYFIKQHKFTWFSYCWGFLCVSFFSEIHGIDVCSTISIHRACILMIVSKRNWWSEFNWGKEAQAETIGCYWESGLDVIKERLRSDEGQVRN